MGIIIILLATIFDAWRDAWLGKAWWPRHTVKWVAFYTPLIYISWRDGLFSTENRWDFLLLAIGCLGVWRLMYRTMGKKARSDRTAPDLAAPAFDAETGAPDRRDMPGCGRD